MRLLGIVLIHKCPIGYANEFRGHMLVKDSSSFRFLCFTRALTNYASSIHFLRVYESFGSKIFSATSETHIMLSNILNLLVPYSFLLSSSSQGPTNRRTVFLTCQACRPLKNNKHIGYQCPFPRFFTSRTLRSCTNRDCGGSKS